MSDWIEDLFIKHSDLFLKLLDFRWERTKDLVNGMVKVLRGFKIKSGKLLDLCCGNGRVSIHMAEKGFSAVGVDISAAFVESARRRAIEHKASDLAVFLEGDVRRLVEVVGSGFKPFDIVVNVWTSVGYYSKEEDLSIFKQARDLSREGAILFVAETAHSEYLSLAFTPTSYMELEDVVLLENRKYDPVKSHISSSWSFYRKVGKDLRFLDTVKIEQHVYNLNELCTLLSEAGWEAVAIYGSLATLQPRSPLSPLNIVAKAK